MKWKPISELNIQRDMLFRIEDVDGDITYAVGYLEDGGGILNVIDYAGYDGYWDYKFLCSVNNLQDFCIKSIYFADPKEIELPTRNIRQDNALQR